VKQRETLPTQEDLVTQTNISRLMEAAEIWVKVKYIENAFIGF